MIYEPETASRQTRRHNQIRPMVSWVVRLRERTVMLRFLVHALGGLMLLASDLSAFEVDAMD